MLEFAKTIPANCKKIKEETYAQRKAFKRFPNTHQRKSRFGLTKGAGQCFIFWNGLCEKATNWSGEISFSARHLILARHSWTS